MLRLSLLARLTMLVLIAISIAWLVVLGRFYRAYNAFDVTGLPKPGQLVTLVDLIEKASSEDRANLASILAAGNLTVRFGRPEELNPLQTTQTPAPDGVETAYRAALGTRRFSISRVPTPLFGWGLLRPLPAIPDHLAIDIALADGDSLIIETHPWMLVSSIGLPLGFGAGLFGTIVALVALILMHRQAKPLTRLVSALDTIDPGGAPIQLPRAVSHVPEIRVLIDAFNRLQSRLSRLIRARIAMVGGISHDVRTFATRLRLRVDQIPDPVSRQRAVDDIDDMIRLLDDSLLASRAGVGELAEELVDFALIVIREIEDRKLPQGRMRISVAPDAASTVILGDRLALRRIVANLVDNALKHAPHVAVTLSVEAGHFLLIIDDDGPGIPFDKREDLLEPFVRLEGSRNRATGGAGLGLAIVRTLAEAHGGGVLIQDSPMGGARIAVRLPVFHMSA
jgi:signal transduction histidine kinase